MKEFIKPLSLFTRLIDAARRLKKPIAAVAAVGAVLGGLAGYWNAYHAARQATPAQIAGMPTSRGGSQQSAASDRRMTFAVLPIASPTGDRVAAQLAASTTETLNALAEAAFLWSRVRPRQIVEDAVAKPLRLKQLGENLDVRFLFRGTITRSPEGYRLDLAVIDAETEQVIATLPLEVDIRDGQALPIRRKTLDGARGYLTYAALKVEVAQSRKKTDLALDVRDLSYRAYVDWGQCQNDTVNRIVGYRVAMKSLDQALTLSPNDPLALYVSAYVNTCACLYSWAEGREDRERIGAAALERFLELVPTKADMLVRKSQLSLNSSRYSDALTVAEDVLKRAPDDITAWYVKILALLRLGRAKDALAALETGKGFGEEGEFAHLEPAVYFSTGDYQSATRLAKSFLPLLSERQLVDPGLGGGVALTLAAAEAQSGNIQSAKKIFSDLHAKVPQIGTITQVKQWLTPSSPVPSEAAFFDALVPAGAKE